MVDDRSEDVALVLDAGGARSAYQVGALQVLLPVLSARGERPRLLVGASAGALLAASLVATAHLDAEEQAERLRQVLGAATKRHVMRPLWRQVPRSRRATPRRPSGCPSSGCAGCSAPARWPRTLAREHRLGRAAPQHRGAGVVDAVAVTTTAVRTGQVVAVHRGRRLDLPRPAPEHHRRFVSAQLGVEHLMASSAIPLLFPSVQVQTPPEAAGWYVDGATRRRAPVAPALELGGRRVVVVGTGSLHPADPDPEQDLASVDLGDGGATLLGSVMDDPLRHDLHRLAEVNDLVARPGGGPGAGRRTAPAADGSRTARCPYVAVAPDHGAEISALALEVYRSNHGTLRGTLSDPDLQVMHRLMGSDSPLQGELLSYLLFDPDFFDAAAAIGRRDAQRWVDDHPELWRSEPLPRAAGTDA